MGKVFEMLRIVVTEGRKFAARCWGAIGPLLLWVPPVAAVLWFAWDIPRMNGNYALKEAGQVEADSVVSQPLFSYYLDRSLSMRGFAAASDGTMGRLADILTDVNQSRGDNSRFFFCDSTVSAADSRSFYDYMRDGSAIKDYYDGLTDDSDEDTGLSTEGVTGSELTQKLESLNLANLFTYPTVEGYRYEDNDENVNIIITDLNFYLSGSGEDRPDQLLAEFARQVAEHASSADLCIYHLQSSFVGLRDDAYSEADPLRLPSVPYFVIVLAKNTGAFDDYLAQFEGAMSKYGLSYSDKFMMKSDPIQGRQAISFEEEAFFDPEATVRSGFNFANGLVKDRPDTTIGLQLLEGSSGGALLQLPVSAMNGLLPGAATQSSLLESAFEVKVSTVSPNWVDRFGESRPGAVPTPVCRAYTASYRDQDCLHLAFSAEAPAERRHWPWKNYYVTDIQFYLRNIAFSMPDWVEELNITDGVDSDGKVRGLSSFFQTLLDAKGTDYANLPERQRYLGSVAVYVSY